MKVKVLDLAAGGDIEMRDEEELWEGGWDGYLESIKEGSIDNLPFDPDITEGAMAVNRKYFVIDDGGEAVITNDMGVNWVCWRGDQCRVWREEDYQTHMDIIRAIGFDLKDFVW